MIEIYADGNLQKEVERLAEVAKHWKAMQENQKSGMDH